MGAFQTVSFADFNKVRITCHDWGSMSEEPFEKLGDSGNKCRKCGKEFTLMVGTGDVDVLKTLAGSIALLEQAQGKFTLEFVLQAVEKS